MDVLFAAGFWWLVLTFAGVNAIFVLGLNIQVGDTGLLNFGQVAFMAVGAYGMGLMLEHGLPIAAAIPLSLLAGALLGILLGIPTLRLRADYFAIVTIAAGEILRITINNEADTTGGPQGLLASGPWRDFNRSVLDWLDSTFGWDVDRRIPLLVLVWVVAILVALLLHYMTKSPWGRVLHAVRENEDAASAVGKPVFSLKLQALAIGGMVGALSGVFFAFASTTVYPENFLPVVTFIGFAVLIAGGIGSYLGVLVASVIMGVIVDGSLLLELSWISPERLASLRFIVVGVVIMAIMAFRPQGIFGKKEELHLGD